MKSSKYYVLSFFLILVVDNCFSQWKTAEANNIKDDTTITYEVTYDKELTPDEKKSKEYVDEITVTFNNGNLIERRFGDMNKSTNVFTLYNYNTLKMYMGIVSEKSKIALETILNEPKVIVNSITKSSSKTFFDFPCEKGFTMINNKSQEVYFTKKIGLRYCKQFKIDGFLLQYPGYSKTLGNYTVKAKKIVYDDLSDSFYSLHDFKIETIDGLKKSLVERKERLNEIRINLIGKTAETFKEFNIKNEKIDTEKLSGDVIVYNFWFTTCAPCKAEIPKLNQVKAKYKDKNVHFISIALDPEYKITPFLETTPLDYEIIPDGQWIAEKFGVTAYPTNIIVDKKGIIQFCELGNKTDIIERMSTALDKYLQ